MYVIAGIGIVLAAFVLAMVFHGPTNREVARWIDAPPGRSFSAHLWALEQDPAAEFHRAGKALRWLVDLGFSPWQTDHCRQSFENKT
jgi:hypothetical protein